MRTFRSAEERQETKEQSMRAMRARGVNGYGDLKLVNLLLSARETSDRFVQRPRLADPERKTTWAT